MRETGGLYSRAARFHRPSPRPLLAALLLLVACGEPEPIPTVPASEPDPEPAEAEPPDDAVPDCPPLRATVNDAPVELAHGYAVRSGERLTVHLLNHDAIGCEQVLAGGWASPPDQVWMRAELDADGDGRVGFANVTTNGDVEALRRPTEVGAPAVLCLREAVTFARGIGRPGASLQGRVEGTFCGERPAP